MPKLGTRLGAAAVLCLISAPMTVLYASAPAMACAWTPTIESNYYATSLDYPDHVQVICELTVENITWDGVSYWSNAENRWMPLGHGTARHYRPVGLEGQAVDPSGGDSFDTMATNHRSSGGGIEPFPV